MEQFRTHTCGALRKSEVGQTVKIAGWVHSVRDHGGVIFIDLRDHYGLTQVVIDPEKDFYQELERWRVESVIAFTGTVVARTPETVNSKLATGKEPAGQRSQLASKYKLMAAARDLALTK